MNKIRFNIFEHLQNKKFVADILMEWFPVKIRKDDGYPIHICNNCMEKLNSMYDFKMMVLESDSKLSSLYPKNIVAQLEKSILDDKDGNLIKNEDSFVKMEDLESENHEITANTNTFKNGNNNACNVSSPINLDESHEEAKQTCIDECDISFKSESSKDKDDMKDEENDSDSLGNMPVDDVGEFSDSSDECKSSDECSSTKSAPKKIKAKRNIKKTAAKDINKIEGRQKKFDGRKANNPNEKQALLLENPDVERIINSKMSRNEKNHAKVFCKLCNRTFNFRYYVSVHAYVHTGNLRYKCEQCDKYFPKSFFLKQHMNTHAIKQYACEECGKMFATMGLLQVHKITHSDQKPHICTVCNKAFKWRTTYNKHCLTHTDAVKKSYICEQCGKSYSENSSLIKHRKTHNPLKNFICSVCNKGFNSKILLNSHVRRHSDRKKHVCTECGKEFTERSVLLSHILIHTGEKPFQCKICNKSFRQRSVLRLHMRTHTGEMPFPCALCERTFRYKHHMQTHMTKEHSVEGSKVTEGVK
ncbi:hypothetical protein Trydic_g23428 [Trypoxylus dichotomus]